LRSHATKSPNRTGWETSLRSVSATAGWSAPDSRVARSAGRLPPRPGPLDLDQYLSSVWSAAGAPGNVTVGKLWEYYCQYPYLPRLTERAVLERGIHAVFGLLTWEAQGFAVATGYDSATRAMKSSEIWIPGLGPLVVREARKPVPNQVPTTPVPARRRPTASDAAPSLTCGYRTARDALRRNHGAWHAEGPGFESP
jgi:hypothetical protein